MIIRMSIAVVIALFSFSAMAGIFQGNVAGVVLDEKSSEKISGVAITLQAQGKLKSNLPATRSDGRFDLDLERIFPEIDLKRRTIEILFHKAGYKPSNIVLKTDSDEENWDQLEIRLIKPRDIAKLPKAQREEIEKHVSGKGKTLYLFPYAIAEEAKSLQMEMFAQNLLDNITASLRTTVQAAPGVEMDVSIQTLDDIDISPTNIERHYQIGAILNALAMISGIGELSSDEDGKKKIYLRSNYVTIPALSSIRTGNVTVKDQFPARLLNSLRLSEQLNGYWGNLTAFALCIQEFQRAMKPPKNKAQLEEVEKLIVASRAQLSGKNKALDDEFEKLLNIVIEESK